MVTMGIVGQRVTIVALWNDTITRGYRSITHPNGLMPHIVAIEKKEKKYDFLILKRLFCPSKSF